MYGFSGETKLLQELLSSFINADICRVKIVLFFSFFLFRVFSCFSWQKKKTYYNLNDVRWYRRNSKWNQNKSITYRHSLSSTPSAFNCSKHCSLQTGKKKTNFFWFFFSQIFFYKQFLNKNLRKKNNCKIFSDKFKSKHKNTVIIVNWSSRLFLLFFFLPNSLSTVLNNLSTSIRNCKFHF